MLCHVNKQTVSVIAHFCEYVEQKNDCDVLEGAAEILYFYYFN